MFGSITPNKVIRQGDPLSSYLILIFMEGLTALIHDYERKGLIQGIPVAQNAPTISRMLFANYSYIFFKANIEIVNHVLEMLNVFKRASCQ